MISNSWPRRSRKVRREGHADKPIPEEQIMQDYNSSVHLYGGTSVKGISTVSREIISSPSLWRKFQRKFSYDVENTRNVSYKENCHEHLAGVMEDNRKVTEKFSKTKMNYQSAVNNEQSAPKKKGDKCRGSKKQKGKRPKLADYESNTSIPTIEVHECNSNCCAEEESIKEDNDNGFTPPESMQHKKSIQKKYGSIKLSIRQDDEDMEIIASHQPSALSEHSDEIEEHRKPQACYHDPYTSSNQKDGKPVASRIQRVKNTESEERQSKSPIPSIEIYDEDTRKCSSEEENEERDNGKAKVEKVSKKQKVKRTVSQASTTSVDTTSTSSIPSIEIDDEYITKGSNEDERDNVLQYPLTLTQYAESYIDNNGEIQTSPFTRTKKQIIIPLDGKDTGRLPELQRNLKEKKTNEQLSSRFFNRLMWKRPVSLHISEDDTKLKQALTTPQSEHRINNLDTSKLKVGKFIELHHRSAELLSYTDTKNVSISSDVRRERLSTFTLHKNFGSQPIPIFQEQGEKEHKEKEDKPSSFFSRRGEKLTTPVNMQHNTPNSTKNLLSTSFSPFHTKKKEALLGLNLTTCESRSLNALNEKSADEATTRRRKFAMASNSLDLSDLITDEQEAATATKSSCSSQREPKKKEKLLDFKLSKFDMKKLTSFSQNNHMSSSNGKSPERNSSRQNETKTKSPRLKLSRRFTTNQQHESLLQHAVTHNDMDTLQKLLLDENNRTEINDLKPPGVTVFHQACVFGDVNVIQLLLSNGANVSLKTWSKLSPLKIAVMFGHYDVAEVLLVSGADQTDITNGFQEEKKYET